ncbi:amino acid adenylation domain-containing protein, partial [Paenibacillus sp. YSY-4.3]
SSLTYRELDEQASRLAVWLQAQGIGPGQRVGLLLEHSIELVVAVLGVLKSGASYVPIDPAYPAERVAYLAEDSGLTLCLKQKRYDWPKDNAVDIEEMNLHSGSTSYTPSAQPEDEAYLIYTSGSTGKPKGVMVSHRSVINYLWWAKKMYVKEERLAFPLYSSISFDLTVTSLFTPLLTGNPLIVYRQEHKGDLLLRILSEDEAGIIKLTPTHLKMLLASEHKPSRLKRLIVGGENLDSQLAYQVSERFNHEIEIYNEYGPTETVVGCMIHRYDPQQELEGSVPIGIPADNVQIHVLDQYMHPTPSGVIGEIYIGGEGVAKGYWNNPKQTEERFMPDMLDPARRMYKTGDLGRRLSDGTIQYVGRRDEQVKVRGYRIELGEVEAELRSCAGIEEAVVLAQPDKDGEGASLWAYVKARGEWKKEEVLEQLGRRLPEYMVPTQIRPVKEMPVTANGKIDRKALAEQYREEEREYVSPRNSMEEVLVEMWMESLGVAQLGIRDNFFENGG